MLTFVFGGFWSCNLLSLNVVACPDFISVLNSSSSTLPRVLSFRGLRFSEVVRIKDSFGRKRCCMAYCVFHGLSGLLMHWNLYPVLILGRISAGIGTAILFSCFECWMVSEHSFRRGSLVRLVFRRSSVLKTCWFFRIARCKKQNDPKLLQTRVLDSRHTTAMAAGLRFFFQPVPGWQRSAARLGGLNLTWPSLSI